MDAHTRRACRWPSALAAMAALGMAAPAVAGAATLHDGNDSRGVLDVRSVTQEHAATGPVTHTITMYDPWRGRLLGVHRGSAIFITFDTRPGGGFERFAAVFSARGSLHAGVYTRAGRFLGFGTVTRVSSRAIRIQVGRRLLGKPLGYRWSVLTLLSTRTGACRSGCVDKAPNRGSALHDLTAPAVKLPAPPAPSSTTTDIHFSVTDTGGSRLGIWSLQADDGGPKGWQTVAHGSARGAHSVSLTRAEGDAISLRVVARDRFGNVTISPVRTIAFPLDDANTAMSYTGTWATVGAGSQDYQGTLHTSADVATPATVSVSFQGTAIDLLAPGTCGTGSVTIDGTAAGTVTEPCDSGHREVVYSAGALAPGAHTLVVTVTGATFGLDGALVR